MLNEIVEYKINVMYITLITDAGQCQQQLNIKKKKYWTAAEF